MRDAEAPRRSVAAAALALGAAVSLGLARFSLRAAAAADARRPRLELPDRRRDEHRQRRRLPARRAAARRALPPRIDAPRCLLAAAWRPRSLLDRHGAVSRATRRSTALRLLTRRERGRASRRRRSGRAACRGLPPASGRAVAPCRPSARHLLRRHRSSASSPRRCSSPSRQGGTTHAWQAAWIGARAIALLATARAAHGRRAPPGGAVSPWPRRMRQVGSAGRHFGPGLAAYFMFGLGYIGYMTFVVTCCASSALGAGRDRRAFCVLLGVGVIASSWLWAGCCSAARGGAAARRSLNGLLAVRDRAAGAERASAGGVRVRRAVRQRLPVGRRIDRRMGPALPAAWRLVGGRHQAPRS